MADTSPKHFVFVLMPFEETFDDVYNLGIRVACKKAGTYCERVDEQIFHESILERVYNQIAKADVVVADMTGRNPNVFYETGYAHALGKTVILLTQEAEDIPFDLKHYPHVIYRKSISQLQGELERRLRWSVENPATPQPTELDALRFYLRGKELTPGGIIGIPLIKRSESSFARIRLSLALHNGGSGVMDLAQAQVGVIMPRYFQHCLGWETAELPDERCIHLMKDFGALPPGGWKPVALTIDVSSLSDEIFGDWECLLRVFERFGYRDIPFKLRVSHPAEAYEIDVD